MKPAIAHHVAFFVYPGFVLLDLSGPLEAFSAAASLLPGCYRTHGDVAGVAVKFKAPPG